MTKSVLESSQASTQSRCIITDNCFTKPVDGHCREQSALAISECVPKLKSLMDEGITKMFGGWLCCLIQGDIGKTYESSEFLGEWGLMLKDERFLGECSDRPLVWMSAILQFPKNWYIIANTIFALVPSMWTTLRNKSASIKYAGCPVQNC
jgi:hypothetical protein